MLMLGCVTVSLLTDCRKPACQLPHEPTDKPAGEPTDELTVCFTGDVLLDRGVRREIQRRGSVDSLLAAVAPIFRSADATVINLECPLTDRDSPVHKRYIFRGDPLTAQALRRAGITHASLANNHTIDHGRAGLTDTHRYLRQAGITPMGYGTTHAETLHPTLIEKGNLRVALFATVTLPLENWVWVSDKPNVCQASIAELAEAVTKHQNAHPEDYIVTLLHWGTEYHATPSNVQRRDARRLIDAGADVIIGHHPHVIQPVETYRDKYIFYSLGNFIFDPLRPTAAETKILKMRFHPKGISYQIYQGQIRACRPECTLASE